MKETECLSEWLNKFQGMKNTEEAAALVNASQEVIPIIADNIDRLQLEIEPASFEGLLEQLAPEELKGE